MSSDGYDSPVGVEERLDYISVEDYKWPTPPSAKRSRLDEKERRRRHCECQKRFLARKQREFEQLHKQVARLELELQLAEAIRQTHELQVEHSQLTSQQALLGSLDPFTVGNEEVDDAELIVRSLDVDGILAELECPW